MSMTLLNKIRQRIASKTGAPKREMKPVLEKGQENLIYPAYQGESNSFDRGG
jgi:hypothetical protein